MYASVSFSQIFTDDRLVWRVSHSDDGCAGIRIVLLRDFVVGIEINRSRGLESGVESLEFELGLRAVVMRVIAGI